jgi:hypothetical protein
MNNRNTVLPPPDIECNSPPCYAHEVDPVYMGFVQPEPQGHDVSASEEVGAGSNETLEEVACPGLVPSS